MAHGLFLDGYDIKQSNQAIFVEDGELNISKYMGQPIVYTNINDTSDMCINFPISEINYKGDLLEIFSKYVDSDEKLQESFGHFFARKILVGGKLFIKEFSPVKPQADILKFYLSHTYNSAKDSKRISYCSHLTIIWLVLIISSLI